MTIVFLTIPKEPSWHGKTLTEWLERSRASQVLNVGNPSHEPDQAIRAIGTNGLPTLIRLLNAKDGALKSKLIRLVNDQKLIHAHIKTDFEKQEAGLTGFNILGSNALAAFPNLMKLWEHKRGQFSSDLAVGLLSTVAPDTNVFLGALTNCFANSDVEIKRGAAELLQLNFPQEAERLQIYKSFPDLLIKVPTKPVVHARAGEN